MKTIQNVDGGEALTINENGEMLFKGTFGELALNLKKLKEYKDTGMTPEEIMELISRLNQPVQEALDPANMSEELKPCPFCRGKFTWRIGGENDDILFAGCGSPSFCVEWAISFTKPNFENALRLAKERWNRRADGWISVKERLPEECESVLIAPAHGIVRCAVLFDEKWNCNGGVYSFNEVTHWMPLPAPPKEA